jgi:hypothetical protein
MISRSQALRPTTSGAMALTALSMPGTSAARVHSPQPTMPSSVVTFTSTSATPLRAISELASTRL